MNNEDLNFDDIRPYYDHEVNAVLNKLKEHELFNRLVQFIWPGISEQEINEKVGRVKTAFDFQVEFMHYGIREILRRFSSGLTYSGFENIEPGKSYLFISNHRDIMLDSAILQILLVENGHQTSEITFGNNLMTPGFITDFGKLNRMFTVKREGNSRELYAISKQLSSYIRHTIIDKKVSIWIAQRNGRTKDGLDSTQTGLLKMLNISNGKGLEEGFNELNIIPMAISYEYEPCGFLKARETYLSSLHTVYKKDPEEDLNSILLGITGFKGNVHLALGKALNAAELNLEGLENDNEKIKSISAWIDDGIYENYKLFKTNYMAWDIVNKQTKYSQYYTEEERNTFNDFIDNELQKVDLNLKDVKNLVLNIYANPVNQKFSLSLQEKSTS